MVINCWLIVTTFEIDCFEVATGKMSYSIHYVFFAWLVSKPWLVNFVTLIFFWLWLGVLYCRRRLPMKRQNTFFISITFISIPSLIFGEK